MDNTALPRYTMYRLDKESAQQVFPEVFEGGKNLTATPAKR